MSGGEVADLWITGVVGRVRPGGGTVGARSTRPCSVILTLGSSGKMGGGEGRGDGKIADAGVMGGASSMSWSSLGRSGSKMVGDGVPPQLK